MSKKDDFQSLIGNITKVEKTETSSDYYSTKRHVSTEKKQDAEYFKHSAISQSNYDIGSEDTLEFRHSGIQNNIMRKLSKGEMTVYENIDLHGMTTLEAEVYISQTIDNQRFYCITCIRIVHGKGYNAGDTLDASPIPKLKNFTARYLAEHPRVLAYTSCPQNRGGTGAVYVLINQFEKSTHTM
ncbi:MAG: Smr/MutS family protein [Ostreibacterium sp.]